MTACAKRGSFSSPAIFGEPVGDRLRALARREVREVEGPPLRLGDDRAGDDDHVALAEVDALVDHGRQIVSVPDLREARNGEQLHTNRWVATRKTPPVPGRFDGIRFWGWEVGSARVVATIDYKPNCGGARLRVADRPRGAPARGTPRAMWATEESAARGTPRAMWAWATEESAARGTPRAMWATEESAARGTPRAMWATEESAARGTPRAMWATEESPERAARLGRCEVAVLCGRGGDKGAAERGWGFVSVHRGVVDHVSPIARNVADIP